MSPQPHDAVLGNAHHHQPLQDLDLMVRARFPLLYLVTAEEDPTDEVLRQLAQIGHPPRKLGNFEGSSPDRGGSNRGTDPF